MKDANMVKGFIVGGVLLGALWQLEIVFITATNELGWGYDFAGFGDLGLQNYQWRDVWYIVIFVCFLYMLWLLYKRS